MTIELCSIVGRREKSGCACFEIGGYGGIGRRARFRFWCLRRAGSSPVIRSLMRVLVRGHQGSFSLAKGL